MTAGWPLAVTYRELGYDLPDTLPDDEPVDLTRWHFDGWTLNPGPLVVVPQRPARKPARLLHLVPKYAVSPT